MWNSIAGCWTGFLKFLAKHCPWIYNVIYAVQTVAGAMWVTLRYWRITYHPERQTFTERFEYAEGETQAEARLGPYPELPVQVAPRYRG
ncbi:MAG: hypothetical protein N2C14_32165, partial [Planctomycetales bacterium]